VQGAILIINAGSSSIKFSGYGAMDEQKPALLFKGQIESIGSAPHMTAEVLHNYGRFLVPFHSTGLRQWIQQYCPQHLVCSGR